MTPPRTHEEIAADVVRQLLTALTSDQWKLVERECGAWMRQFDGRTATVLAGLREAEDAEHEKVVALHAKLQGAFALLSPEDAERLGITRAMVECEDPACGLYEEHVRQEKNAARQEEREALREIIQNAFDNPEAFPARTEAKIIVALDARSRGDESKPEKA